MLLRLEPSEAELVEAILAEHLRDLRQEIVGTENYELRQQMKSDEESIKLIIARLVEARSGRFAA